MATSTRNETITATFSLYDLDCRKLERAFQQGRELARDRQEAFTGASFDVDADGFVFVHIAGLDTVKL